MTEEILQQQWAVRLAGVRRIRARLAEFKQCGQCQALIHKEGGICPWCRCYRFEHDQTTVRATLSVMARHPWPVNAEVVPRLETAP